MSNNISFTEASDITVNVLLSFAFFALGTAALYIFLRMLFKPQELKKNLLLDKDEERSFVAPLYYSLAAAHSYVLFVLMFFFAFRAITISGNQTDQTEDIDDLITIFVNEIYISDAIFLPIFVILFTQMILFNDYGHLTKGVQFRDNIFTKRTYKMPPEIKCVLILYSVIQLIIILVFNILSKTKVQSDPSTQTVSALVIVPCSIDFAINLSQPLMQIIYEIYSNKRFQGCPIKSKKMESQIRKLRSVLIFFSIGRVFQCILNVLMMNGKNFYWSTTERKHPVLIYGLILFFSLDQIVFQIIPFIITFQKQIKKILLKSFEQSQLIQLDKEQEHELKTQSDNLTSSNFSSDSENFHRYTMSDNQERGVFELKVTDISFGEPFLQPSTSPVQFGQLLRCRLELQRYVGKPFICRRVDSVNISSYMIEEINQDLQKYRKLGHSNIFAIRAMAIDTKFIYFITPYFENLSLGHILSASPNVAREDALRFLRGLCQGLKYLHEKEIIHGALKSNNVMLSKNFEVKIVDFGLHALKKFASLTKGYTTKCQYTAPELLQERSPTPDGTVEGDVYAFGMIAWECFHQKLAFPGLTVPEVIKLIAVEQKRPKIEESLPEEIKDLIRACWQTDPSKRPTVDKILGFLES